jgi:hypothetical protein
MSFHLEEETGSAIIHNSLLCYKGIFATRRLASPNSVLLLIENSGFLNDVCNSDQGTISLPLAIICLLLLMKTK